MPIGLALGAVALILAPVSARAQTSPQPSRAEVQDAAKDLKVIVSAMQSDKVPPPIKTALFQCLYQTTLAKISAGVSKVLAANKLDRSEAGKVLGVMAGICGYRPDKSAKPR